MAQMAVEPLVLLANADKWLSETLESVLTQGGYRVLTTAKRQQVLELARRHLPDAILLDMGLDQRTSAGTSTAPAIPKRPSGARPSSTDRRGPSPTSTTDLLVRARDALD